jgi:hypothetical protein
VRIDSERFGKKPLFQLKYLFCVSGKIACSNVLSDLYAMGVTECDNMLMLMAVSTKMTEKERDVVVPLVTLPKSIFH